MKTNTNFIACSICTMVCALIRCMKFLTRSPNALGCVNVILLHSNHKHVLVTHMGIFIVVRTRIQIQL